MAGMGSEHVLWTFSTLNQHTEFLPEFGTIVQHVTYLRDLKQQWATPEVPEAWTTNSGDDGMEQISHTFHHKITSFCLRLLVQEHKLVSEGTLASRSPYGMSPTFLLSNERHATAHGQTSRSIFDQVQTSKSKSNQQVAQFFLYQSGKYQAQATINNALDGVPCTYVRRNLPLLDSAVVYIPTGPSRPYSFERLRSLPISIANPALVLCSSEQSGREPSDQVPAAARFPETLRAMANVFMVTLKSLSEVCKLRREQDLGPAPGSPSLPSAQLQEPAGVPNWAIPIGVVYDSASIHFVAHIPLRSQDTSQKRYLSLLFDTLPLPEFDPRNSRERLLHDRYRVAFAFLCLQHHLFRMVSLWEGVRLGESMSASVPMAALELLMEDVPGTPTYSDGDDDEYFIEDFDVYLDNTTSISEPTSEWKAGRESVEQWLANHFGAQVTERRRGCIQEITLTYELQSKRQEASQNTGVLFNCHDRIENAPALPHIQGQR
ncbi:hypothetical protein OBBRIDRAFT_829738 [Obba rivulosa]|uniref:Uncharacterized protein n=1 Tax=Obba rivulosa TaxID=1052685 RepID=A0A8E2ANL0_9APHY|nr:hypothetical protein OBBRIDRAFT_829738 [Obba rivulosa]